MLRRYSHTQVESKRAAIQSLSNRPRIAASEQGDVTKHVTKEGERGVIPMQVIEKNGRPVRTRTADLYRVKVGIHVLSATYILSGGCQSLKGTVGTLACG